MQIKQERPVLTAPGAALLDAVRPQHKKKTEPVYIPETVEDLIDLDDRLARGEHLVANLQPMRPWLVDICRRIKALEER